MALLIHSNITAVRKRAVRRLAGLERNIMDVHKFMGYEGKKDFIAGTGGSISTRALRTLGHPFAREGAMGTSRFTYAKRGEKLARLGTTGKKGQVTKKGVVRLLPINRQTGKLRSAITLDGPMGTNHTLKLYSKVFDGRQWVLHPRGTSKMVARGLLGPVGMLNKRHKARRAGYVDLLRRLNRQLP